MLRELSPTYTLGLSPCGEKSSFVVLHTFPYTQLLFLQGGIFSSPCPQVTQPSIPQLTPSHSWVRGNSWGPSSFGDRHLEPKDRFKSLYHLSQSPQKFTLRGILDEQNSSHIQFLLSHIFGVLYPRVVSSQVSSSFCTTHLCPEVSSLF